MKKPMTTAERQAQGTAQNPLQAFTDINPHEDAPKPFRPSGEPSGERGNGNVERLKALLAIFDLSLSDVARVGGCSPALLCRLLHGDQGVKGEGAFRRLESRLPELIVKRRRAYFHLDAVPVDAVREAVAAIKPAA